MSATIGGKKFCDCGNEAPLWRGGDWQCVRCHDLDGQRFRSEREVARKSRWEIAEASLTANADLVLFTQ